MSQTPRAPALPQLECSITFRRAADGGRSTPLRPGALRGDSYRPHLVVGDPTQWDAIVTDANKSAEEYIGVSFRDGPDAVEAGTEITAVLTLMYYPYPMYEKLLPGVSFTIREGRQIVGHGHVLRRLK